MADLDPELRSRLIEEGAKGLHRFTGVRADGRPIQWTAETLAAAVVDALGIAVKPGLHDAKKGRSGWWYPRYEGAAFTIRAAEVSE